MVIEKKTTGPDPDPTEFLFVSLEQKRIDQSKPYDPKKQCWVPDDKEGFVIGEMRGTKGELVTVMVPGNEVSNFTPCLLTDTMNSLFSSWQLSL